MNRFKVLFCLLLPFTLTACPLTSQKKKNKKDNLMCEATTNGRFAEELATTVESQEQNDSNAAKSQVISSTPDVSSSSENSYLITFKKGTKAIAVKRLLGAKLVWFLPRFSIALVKMPLNDQRLLKILKQSDVTAVESDQLVESLQSASSQTQSVSLQSIKVPQAWNIARARGNGVNVAILDTGIDPHHEDLRVIGGQNFTGVGDPLDWSDVHGHGTHVAGIACALDNSVGIVGAAPECNLYSYKVLGDNGLGDFSNIILGVDTAIENGMNVINMSLGANIAPFSAFERTLKTAEESGVVVVAAAGNTGNTGNDAHYPGSSTYVLGVAALNESDSRASFSHASSVVDISAPGTSIYSTTPKNTYGYKSGTSMATPYVAGVAALIKSVFPEHTAPQIKQKILCGAKDLGTPGYDINTGYGKLDALKSIAADQGCNDGEAYYTHDIEGFSATLVESGTDSDTENDVAIKVDIKNRYPYTTNNIQFKIIARNAYDGTVIDQKVYKTNADGQSHFLLKDVDCGRVQFEISEFTQSSYPLTIKGLKKIEMDVY